MLTVTRKMVILLKTKIPMVEVIRYMPSHRRKGFITVGADCLIFI